MKDYNAVLVDLNFNSIKLTNVVGPNKLAVLKLLYVNNFNPKFMNNLALLDEEGVKDKFFDANILVEVFEINSWRNHSTNPKEFQDPRPVSQMLRQQSAKLNN